MNCPVQQHKTAFSNEFNSRNNQGQNSYSFAFRDCNKGVNSVDWSC